MCAPGRLGPRWGAVREGECAGSLACLLHNFPAVPSSVWRRFVPSRAVLLGAGGFLHPTSELGTGMALQGWWVAALGMVDVM